ncbi:NPP1-domain-containing protein [Colletotrichum eremochloae]|nr:NPP1-domain-containing protein [Colletotrichum eremochloae]
MASRLLALSIPLLGFVNSALLPRGGDVAVGDKWLDHDKVVPLSASPDSGLIGDLEEQFMPLIHAWGGCVPYAAVDANGYAGAGLAPTGEADGDCRDSSQAGQTYARVGKSHGRLAILYSYYVPKILGDDKHRHHWLTAVVWLDFDGCPDKAIDFSPRGISYSTTPGKFNTAPAPTLYLNTDGVGPATHPIIDYLADEFLFSSADGTGSTLSPPLVGWGRLPQLVKDQLNGIKYEATKVPFSDENFQAYLDAAYNEEIYKGVPVGVNCVSI